MTTLASTIPPSCVRQGELAINLREARNLPVWGFPGQSNPYCRLTLGEQAVQSRREDDTSHPGVHRCPVWNQVWIHISESIRQIGHISLRCEASCLLHGAVLYEVPAGSLKDGMFSPRSFLTLVDFTLHDSPSQSQEFQFLVEDPGTQVSMYRSMKRGNCQWP